LSSMSLSKETAEPQKNRIMTVSWPFELRIKECLTSLNARNEAEKTDLTKA